jgi:uncharacterized protein YkwD
MKNTTQKTKYTIQTAIISLIFVFLTSVAQASEITPSNIIKYVNIARASQGIPEVVVNEKLMKVAQDKLNDMIANKYFAHTSPTGVNPWFWYQRENYDYHFAGENLAINFTSVESEQEAWMASPTHRKNILDSNYQEIGVAVGKQESDGQVSLVAVQEFGTTFAGIGEGKKNFSPLKNSDVIKKGNEIIPQVLSVKVTAPDQSNPLRMKGMGYQRLLDWFSKNELEIINQSCLMAMLVILFSIALMATAFLALALDKMWAISEKEKAKKAEHMA